ncbi:MAG: hypothetical protein IH840_03320 [Candidatus Heimdallarchaeota archaeon]|nr:hypothetical protein [Candidatus Heimdallarchaeota archaeon]
MSATHRPTEKSNSQNIQTEDLPTDFSQGVSNLVTLAQDLSLLEKIGKIKSIKVNLIDVRRFNEILSSMFYDQYGSGLFIENSILCEPMDYREINILDLMMSVLSITGSTSSIENLEVRLKCRNNSDDFEIHLGLEGNHKPPILLKVIGSVEYSALAYDIHKNWTILVQNNF